MPLPLFSRTLGNPTAPRVIIVHGLCGSGRNWLSVGEKIAAAGFCVELLDMRDHGQSPWSDDLSYSTLVEDFLAHIENKSKGEGVTQPFIFVGHSMGGKLGMTLAAKHLKIFENSDATSNLKGICVVDMAPKSYSPSYLPALIACRDLDLSTIHSRKEADEKLSRTIPNETFRQFLLSNLSRDKDDHFKWNCNYALIAKDLKNITGTNPIEDADRYDGPTFFIAGSRSDFVSPADNQMLKKHFPNMELRFLPTGHNVHIESPEVFVKTFTEWANKL